MTVHRGLLDDEPLTPPAPGTPAAIDHPTVAQLATFIEQLVTRVLERIEKRDDETAEGDVIAVMPVMPQQVWVQSASWYEYDETGELLDDIEAVELIGVAITRTGEPRSVVIHNGCPQVLSCYEYVAAQFPEYLLRPRRAARVA